MPDREHVVLVLPGIGGSLLAPPGALDRPVWSASPRDLGLLRRPEALSTAAHPRLVPVGLVPTRKAMPFWTPVHGYNGLLRRLGALPGAVVDDGTPARRDLTATVVGFGYDFRLGVEDAAARLSAAVDQRLAALWPQGEDHNKRLIIVAHSLGGLVARYWLAQSEKNWRRCRALITLGTPHAGAPKALDVLVNGLSVKGVHVLAGRFRPLLLAWPSMAELLPRFPAVRQVAPGGAPDSRPVWLRPHELPIPWLVEPATAAFQVHRAIEEGWATIPRSGPQVIARIGYGHSTLRSGTWDGRRLRITGDAPNGVELGSWADDLGDGTVPAFCGQPLELGAQHEPGMLVAERHSAIADLAQTVEWVQGFEERPRVLAIRGEERPVALGLDVGDLQPAGMEVELRATVRGVDADLGRVPVWATVTSAAAPGARLQEVPLTLDSGSGGFAGALAPLPPGLYDIRVTAESVPGGGDLASLATVEVLDDADLG